MNSLREYQPLAVRTLAPAIDREHDALHCILGMVGESVELYDAIAQCNGHLGELGDSMWYTANLCQLLNLKFDEVYAKVRMDSDLRPMLLLDQTSLLTRVAGDMAEHIKKVIFYKAPLDVDKVTALLTVYTSTLCSLIETSGLGPLAVAEANIKKLEKRYPDLRFSAEAALNRDYAAESAAAGTTIL